MKVFKLAILAISFSLGPLQTYGDQTNLVQNVQIQLFGVSQGGTFTNHNVVATTANFAGVDARRVIAALAAATANSFSTTSRLVVVTPLAGGPCSIQVRDGSTKVDVTGFFVYQALSDPVNSSILNSRSGRWFSTEYSIERFALQDADGYPTLGLHFDVRGFTTQTSTAQGGNLSADVAGMGDRNGRLLLLQGSISVRGQTLEVVADTGGGQT